MNLAGIMSEANSLTPNGFTDQQRYGWLSELNREFFEVVKIPAVFPLVITQDKSDYLLTSAVTMRNIDKVVAGTQRYDSLQMTDVTPGNAGWTYDETSFILSLQPAPSYDCDGYVRYAKVATTTEFRIIPVAIGGVITGPELQVPDAPSAYHEAYVYGLAEKMAVALDDMVKATNHGQQYRAKLAIAQTNYQRGG